jgi:hypothetical protein
VIEEQTKEERTPARKKVNGCREGGKHLELTGATNDTALISQISLPERFDTNASLRAL